MMRILLAARILPGRDGFGLISENGWWFCILPLADRRQATIDCRGPADDLFKGPVKMGERLEPDRVGDFADTQVAIQEEIFCLFNPGAGDKFGQAQAAGFTELFAKIKPAG